MQKRMRKASRIILISIAGLFAFSDFAAAVDRQMTVNSSYPSPFGGYKQLSLKRAAIGADYMNASSVCWVDEVCPANSSRTETATSLVVQGKVGIGTIYPNFLLDIHNGFYVDNQGNVKIRTMTSTTAKFFAYVSSPGIRLQNYDAANGAGIAFQNNLNDTAVLRMHGSAHATLPNATQLSVPRELRVQTGSPGDPATSTTTFSGRGVTMSSSDSNVYPVLSVEGAIKVGAVDINVYACNATREGTLVYYQPGAPVTGRIMYCNSSHAWKELPGIA
ncbi:MAG TPA: hypothetical protein PLO78_07550 [Candidatus Omnitrophota bacterium]|nr:hypothetical protein [Candidatus Omnitrophota bacterium]